MGRTCEVSGCFFSLIPMNVISFYSKFDCISFEENKKTFPTEGEREALCQSEESLWREKPHTWSQCTHSVFEAVPLSSCFAAQVDEIVCHASCILWGHLPGNVEWVTGHFTDLDVMGCGEEIYHLGHRLERERDVKRWKITPGQWKSNLPSSEKIQLTFGWATHQTTSSSLSPSSTISVCFFLMINKTMVYGWNLSKISLFLVCKPAETVKLVIKKRCLIEREVNINPETDKGVTV